MFLAAGIDFKMPFCKQHPSDNSNSSNSNSQNSPQNDSLNRTEEGEEFEGEPLDDKEATSFLANLGVDTSQFTNLTSNRQKKWVQKSFYLL